MVAASLPLLGGAHSNTATRGPGREDGGRGRELVSLSLSLGHFAPAPNTKNKANAKRPRFSHNSQHGEVSPSLPFTDLSAAGLPAELKHITQRRKRKQP